MIKDLLTAFIIGIITIIIVYVAAIDASDKKEECDSGKTSACIEYAKYRK